MDKKVVVGSIVERVENKDYDWQMDGYYEYNGGCWFGCNMGWDYEHFKM